jgi:hypothetical protein
MFSVIKNPQKRTGLLFVFDLGMTDIQSDVGQQNILPQVQIYYWGKLPHPPFPLRAFVHMLIR